MSEVPKESPPRIPEQTERAERRLVLLRSDENSDVEEVLGTYDSTEPRERDLHAEIERFAMRNKGRVIAAEWHGPLGWTRFMTCRKE
ncbi:MAG: hypothetical protein ACFCD0_19145 [Gemmataceae bacterium]